MTAVSNGTVTARATANDGSGVFGSIVITISNQLIPVTGIIVTADGGLAIIETDDGTLQLAVIITPSNASDKTISWSLINGIGHAYISSSGIVTAHSNGKITVRATANDGSGVYGEIEITITNQIIKVKEVRISKRNNKYSNAEEGINSIQLEATIIPADATDQTVTWSIFNGTGEATIDESGLVTPVLNGTVTARATANDGSGVYGELELEIMIEVIEGMKLIRQGDLLIVQIPDSYISADIRLNNMIGNLLSSKKAVSNECTFNVSQYPTGIYIIVVYKVGVLEVAKIQLTR